MINESVAHVLEQSDMVKLDGDKPHLKLKQPMPKKRRLGGAKPWGISSPKWLRDLMGEREEAIASDPEAYIVGQAGDEELEKTQQKIVSPTYGTFTYDWKLREIVA